MLHLVIAHDGRDSEAPERRRRVRERHLEAMRPLIEAGTLQLGGAYLDEKGEMRGSVLLLEAEDLDAVQQILDADIYTQEGVWERFEIRPFKRAV